MMKGFFTTLLPLALVGLQVSPATPLYIPHNDNGTSSPSSSSYYYYPYPTRTIANITVIDTPLVREARAYARAHTSSDAIWNHVMRGWLLGAALLARNATLRAAVDPEVHALAALLHDLGWDRTPGAPTVSADRRFEVDGAVAARDFIRERGDPRAWGAGDGDGRRRTQLVWDAITLHTQPSIYTYKEPDVAVVGQGILADFAGPSFGITEAEYADVVRAFPRVGFVEGVNDTFVWLCQTKPQTTYDTFMQAWGDNFVANYSAEGYRIIDTILGAKD
ncbi:hypothetical protein F4778DRAFT_786041 [Xylariomycetidae sp. FL2044]|nr:hypothetical protein F4778DRAFT_786041 [Xylariomycetidae sp. FL2044]